MPNLRVLVPLDGSRLAEQALVYLNALRGLGELDVRLVSVVDAKEAFGTPNPTDAVESETNLLSAYLREVSRALQQHLGLDASFNVPTGSPVDRILAEAEEYEADIILIGTHGRSGLSRWRFGSVSDKVIRGATGNVLVINPKASVQGPWHEALVETPFMRLLVPLDNSSLAEEALPLVKSFSEAYSPALHLVHVIQLPTAYDAFSTRRSFAPDLLDNIIQVTYSYLSDQAQQLDRPDAVTQVLVGPPADKLHEYVDENQIDLVIMTSRGRGGILRTILGSVTDRMLDGSVPVLVVRS